MSHTKTIAFVINSLNSGGAERVLSTLSNEFSNKHRVVIITLTACTPFYPLADNIEVVSCQQQQAQSANPFQAIRSNYRLYKKIKSYLKEYAVDVCIAFMTSANILATLASRNYGIPVIISERNNPNLEDHLISGYWKFIRKKVYPRATKIVVQTSPIKTYYEKFIPPGKLKTIPNPLNPDFESTPVLKKENIVINVGRLADQKGQDTLIKAFTKVSPKGWHLNIYGEGVKRDTLQALIDHKQMQGQIFLKGQSEDIGTAYSRSKIFGFTSRFEGFPNALMEAMHFGLACISSDCPTGPSELIEHGLNGYLVPVDDVDELAQKLAFLIENEEERNRIGRAAKLTMEQYKVDAVFKVWDALVKEVAA